MKVISLDTAALLKSHSAEETSTPTEPQKASVVPINHPKCKGCYHYNAETSRVAPLCMIGSSPEKCGDGSEPETGYAPLVTDQQAMTDWKAKRGLHYIVPRSSVRVPDEREEVQFQVESLGEEAVQKGKKIPCGKCGGTSYNDIRGRLGDCCLKKSAPPGWSEATMHKLKRKHGVKSAFKIAWAAYEKQQAKKALPAPKKPASATGAGHKGVMLKVRENMVRHPHPVAEQKAREHGGGSVFHHSKLARLLSVQPRDLARMAIDSHHATHFVQQIRQKFKEHAKDISDNQLRSAYHSTGLRHSLEGDNDMAKKQKSAPSSLKKGENGLGFMQSHPNLHVAHTKNGRYSIGRDRVADAQSGKGYVYHLHFTPKSGSGAGKPQRLGSPHLSVKSAKQAAMEHHVSLHKSLTIDDLENLQKSVDAKRKGKSHVIGHTRSGKPVHAEAGPAPHYHGAFDKNDHEDAAELHNALASKFSAAADRYGSSGYGTSSAPLNPASRDLMQKHAEHHRRMSAGHNSARWRATDAEAVPSQPSLDYMDPSFHPKKGKDKTIKSFGLGGQSPSHAGDMLTHYHRTLK